MAVEKRNGPRKSSETTFFHSPSSFYIFLLQLGVALGFVIPVMAVKNQKQEKDIHLIGDDLFHMFLGVAIATTVLLVAILLSKSTFSYFLRLKKVGTPYHDLW